MCRAGGMCAAQEVFCGVCAAQEVIMFRVGGLCGVCAAAGLYLWATVPVAMQGDGIPSFTSQPNFVMSTFGGPC